MELDEQSWEELPTSELLPEQNHKISQTTRKAVHRLARDIYRVLRFAVSEWTNCKVKELDDNAERNIRTSFNDSPIAFYKENYSYDKDKYDTPQDKKQHILQQYIKHPGPA